MKKYEMVQLNKGVSLSREKDLQKAVETLNAMAAEGWELMQVTSPNDLDTAMYGVFVKEV